MFKHNNDFWIIPKKKDNSDFILGIAIFLVIAAILIAATYFKSEVKAVPVGSPGVIVWAAS